MKKDELMTEEQIKHNVQWISVKERLPKKRMERFVQM